MIALSNNATWIENKRSNAAPSLFFAYLVILFRTQKNYVYTPATGKKKHNKIIGISRKSAEHAIWIDRPPRSQQRMCSKTARINHVRCNIFAVDSVARGGKECIFKWKLIRALFFSSFSYGQCAYFKLNMIINRFHSCNLFNLDAKNETKLTIVCANWAR